MNNLSELLASNPRTLGGAVVFRGTRVPLQALIDYLAGGDSLDEFLTDYPGVSREVATAVILALGTNLDLGVRAAAS